MAGLNRNRWQVSSEYAEVIRNTKTIFLMIFMPLMLFPLLFIGMGYFTGKQIEKTEKSVPKIVITNFEDALDLMNFIKKSKSFNIVKEAEFESALEKSIIELVVQIPVKFSENIQKDIPVIIKILYDQSNVRSIYAHEKLIKIFNNYKEELYKNKLVQKGIDEEFLNLLNITSKNIASSKKMGAFVIGRLLPFFLLILAFTGAMYTALSITVGEKERQTIETILVSSIKRQEIVMGKFLTVFTTSLITAFLGLVSLFFTFQIGFVSLSLNLNIQISISLFSVLIMFILIFPVAGIFSTILITLGSFARTQKEGEMYASILLIVIIALSIISFIPGFEPTSKLFFILVINTTLIQKELLMSKFSFPHIVYTLLTTVFFALFCLYTTFKLFSSEEIIFRT